MTSLALLAFLFQSYAVQTHIHPELNGLDYSALTASAPSHAANIGTSLERDHHAPAPLDDTARCPLCQEFLHAGAYLTPVPAALALPSTITVVAPLAAAPIAIVQTVSHAWRGRGPPSA